MQVAGRPSIFAYPNFGEFFAAQIEHQRQKNPAFSCRALARRLGRSPSLLTMIARGERMPQTDLVQELAGPMGLSDPEREYAETLVNFQRAKSVPARQRFASKLRQLKPANDDLLLTLDQFEMIANWYHLTVLELTQLPGFVEDLGQISRYLGLTVTPDMVRESIELLLRLGLAARDEKGRLYKVKNVVHTPRNIPSAAIRTFHRQMMMRAHQAVERQSVKERYLTASTLTVPASKLPEVMAKIAAFREQMLADLREAKDANEIYQLNIQFFRATTEPAFPKV